MSGRKRGTQDHDARLPPGQRKEESESGLGFEDPFGDDYESDGEVVESDGEPGNDPEKIREDEDEQYIEERAWRPEPGVEEEELEFDPTTYVMLHQLQAEWPSLSFDIVLDDLGYERSSFPHTMFLAAGTQADTAENNAISILKLSHLGRTLEPGSDDEEEVEGVDGDGMDPAVEELRLPHIGCVNRIRCMPQSSRVVATWSDSGMVNIYDVETQLRMFREGRHTMGKTEGKPAFTFKGHETEGYGIAWSPRTKGRLVTGDGAGNIFLWEPREATWAVPKQSFQGHKESVEDIAWSPHEENGFMTCSCDGTVRIWDARERRRHFRSVKASNADVNVVSWNEAVGHVVVSGDDEGVIKAWDLRRFVPDQCVSQHRYHEGAITSIQWKPNDPSVLVASGEDHMISLWDLGLEADADARDGKEDKGAPTQLLFEHWGLRDPKEVRWHPQIPGVIVATGLNWNVFQTINSK